MTFSVIGAEVSPRALNGHPFAVVAATCRKCGLPIVGVFASNFDDDSSILRQRLTQAIQNNSDLATAGLSVARSWPKAEGPQIPESLPAEVERAFLQAERNFALPDCEEAAAMMYRRALEVGLKIAYPDMTGMLAKRIKTLVAEHHLPVPIGDWLDQVRLIGNDGAHEEQGVTRDDLDAERGFVDMALRYIFTMPAQIAARRGLPPEVA